MKLNQLLAKQGIASRRKINDLIKSRRVTVNDEITNGFTIEIKKTDKITINWRDIPNPRDYKKKPTFVKPIGIANVYLVLNKPLGYITSFYDPWNKKTVYDLLPKEHHKTLHNMGRLDKGTSGVLLFSNDGTLTKKLTHPKREIPKKYQVALNKAILKSDFDKIKSGLRLADGFIKADELTYRSSTKKKLMITIHSGKNKIIRRMFAHLSYRIVALERIAFAGITATNVPLGKWRLLSQLEIQKLKGI